MSSVTRVELAFTLAREVRKFIAGVILFNEQVAASLGLNGTDLQCLHILELQGSATPGELARWSLLTTGGVTVVLDRLERAGYVKREPNPKDRRSTIVRPVPARLRKLESMYRSRSDLLRGVLAGFTDVELETVLDFFRRSNAANAPAHDTLKER